MLCLCKILYHIIHENLRIIYIRLFLKDKIDEIIMGPYEHKFLIETFIKIFILSIRTENMKNYDILTRHIKVYF